MKDKVLFVGDFSARGPNNVVTNEFAHWNPENERSIESPDWELTSGTLYSRDGAGWTGVPDDKTPGPTSAYANNSAVFRLTTRRADFGDVEVSLKLLNKGLHSTPSTPPQPYDGVHIFLRYQSEYSLYYASINRRENNVVIKKKTPGGNSNGGTYHELSPYLVYKVPYGVWQDIRATIRNGPAGSVLIELYSGKRLLASATDTGEVGGPAIREPGKVGLRVDNAEVFLKNFEVSRLAQKAPASSR